MGNQQSSSDGNTASSSRTSRPFSRGALGLSKSELDRRCQASGLYDSCQWEERAIRKLVGDGKIAARLKGNEKRSTEEERECPICFLHYSEINVTKCCHANVCTECYLQVRPQKEKSPTCPFCNNNKLQVTVAKKMEQKQIEERDKEEKMVLAAQLRARAPSSDDGTAPTNGDITASESGSGSSGFGSSLEQNSMVAIAKKRSESFASEDNNIAADDVAIESIQSLAMTPEERRALEDEMRAQHSHPLALRIQAEAAERRLENERSYYQNLSRDPRTQRAAELFAGELFRSGSGSGTFRRSRGRGSSGRDWNQIVEALERGGTGHIQSIDDLVLLEAALVMSMDESGRRGRNGDDSTLDSARHARDGFPRVRSLLSSRRTEDDLEDGGGEAGFTSQQVHSLARHVGNSRRSRRHQLLRSMQSARSSTGSAALDTAAMIMRGISEEEQMALAIAASLQDHSNQNSSTGDSDDASQESNETDNMLRASGDELELETGERAVVGIILDDDDDDGGEAEVDSVHDASQQEADSGQLGPLNETDGQSDVSESYENGESTIPHTLECDVVEATAVATTSEDENSVHDPDESAPSEAQVDENEDPVVPDTCDTENSSSENVPETIMDEEKATISMEDKPEATASSN